MLFVMRDDAPPHRAASSVDDLDQEDPYRIGTVEQLEGVIGTSKLPFDLENHRSLDPFAVDFISRSSFLVLTTASAAGAQDISPKGDTPGFVQVEDTQTLLIPDRPGNKLALGHRNLLENPRLAILFMIPGTRETLRISGTGQLTSDPALCERLSARGRPAVLVLRVRVEECFFHCAKAFIRSNLWQPDQWAEPYHRVSLGDWLAHTLGADEATARAIDSQADESYRTQL